MVHNTIYYKSGRVHGNEESRANFVLRKIGAGLFVVSYQNGTVDRRVETSGCDLKTGNYKKH